MSATSRPQKTGVPRSRSKPPPPRVNTPPMPRLLDLATTADLLGVCPRTVRRWIDAGALSAARIGRGIRISEEDIRSYLQRSRLTSRQRLYV